MTRNAIVLLIGVDNGFFLSYENFVKYIDKPIERYEKE